jgi:MoxR-like ATPase
VPADLVGTRIYNQKTGEFSTSLGPVFANLLLADEINRAPAKVQSALLEVMQERQVTIAGETHKVPVPFLVMADAEPDRDRGHVPAARGAGRPLHDEGAGRLPERGRRVRHRAARDGRAGPS